MKVQAINTNNYQQNNTSFTAKINKNTPAMRLACSYMEKCRDLQPPYANTKVELQLFNLIEKAFNEHPSGETLNRNAKMIRC